MLVNCHCLIVIDPEITTMSSGASESDDEVPIEDSLLLCARRGQTEIIRDILSSNKNGKVEVDINCKGT